MQAIRNGQACCIARPGALSLALHVDHFPYSASAIKGQPKASRRTLHQACAPVPQAHALPLQTQSLSALLASNAFTSALWRLNSIVMSDSGPTGRLLQC